MRNVGTSRIGATTRKRASMNVVDSAPRLFRRNELMSARTHSESTRNGISRPHIATPISANA